MNDDRLEKRLSELPRREVPEEWREGILAAARVKPRRDFAWLAWPALRQMLWPHPYAWAGVAALWVVIAGLNFSGPRGEALYAVGPANGKSTPISTEQYAAYLRQTRLFLAVNAPVTPVIPRLDPNKL